MYCEARTSGSQQRELWRLCRAVRRRDRDGEAPGGTVAVSRQMKSESLPAQPLHGQCCTESVSFCIILAPGLPKTSPLVEQPLATNTSFALLLTSSPPMIVLNPRSIFSRQLISSSIKSELHVSQIRASCITSFLWFHRAAGRTLG
jgi:hypothetical protein